MNGGFPGGPVEKNLPANAGDVGLIPGWDTQISEALELSSTGLQSGDEVAL